MSEHYYTELPSSRIETFIINPIIRNRKYQFKTCSGVFAHKKLDKGTEILLKFMEIPKIATHVLDMGTGYGVIGIVIAIENPKLQVIMTDINRRAVWIARENVQFHKLKNVRIFWGDFYAPIKNLKFDIILTNPPLALGQKKIKNFINETPDYMKRNGFFYLVARTRQGAKKIAEMMRTTFGNVELIKIQSGYRLFRAQKFPNESFL
ncbi:MAG: class I SAM-dependent methyltransferase [Candidatus Helarchaeota archaeon]